MRKNSTFATLIQFLGCFFNTRVMANEVNQNQQFTTRKRNVSANVFNSYEVQGKLPPQAIDLEEAVLGALLIEKEAVNAVIDILQPETFYVEKHQKIFRAIKDLFGQSEPIDILTVTQQLKRNGHLEDVGGPVYIQQLTSRIVSGSHIESHARIIMQKYILRELIRISSETITSSFDETNDVFDVLDDTENKIFQIGENNLRRSYGTMKDLVGRAIDDIEKAKAAGADGSLRGVPSGYSELDSITQGWQKSDLIILAARPSMGKTAFALNLARNAAVMANRPVAFFSLEMSDVQLVTRLISTETEITADLLRSGNLDDELWSRLHTKVAPLNNAPIFIDDTPQLSVFELRAKCRRLKQQHNIQMIFIDYLQLMTTKGENKGNREQEISMISRSLKSLAKELDVPVLALSQLSRSVETRPGSRKPILSDLRESGAIEQDADMVIFIYRPEYYKQDVDPEKPKGYTIIDIAKHRNGKLGEVELQFIGQYAKFVDYNVGIAKDSIEIKPNTKFATFMSTATNNSPNNNIEGGDILMPRDDEPPY